MKNKLKTILIVVLIFGTITRISNMGWLMVLGLLSISVFGSIHYYTQKAFLDKLFLKPFDFILIILSHICYLGTLIFQGDGGDSGSSIAINKLLHIELIKDNTLTMELTWLFIILFLLLTIINSALLKKNKSTSIR